MRKNLRFVGLDVHKDSIAIAVAENGRQPAQLLETIDHDEPALLRVLERLGPKASCEFVTRRGPRAICWPGD